MPWLNPYAILGVVLAVLAAAGGGYLKGHRDADRSAEVRSLREDRATLQAQADELRRQAKAAQAIADEASERQRAAEKIVADRTAEIDDYVRRLEQSPQGCDCSLSVDDVERLRHIGTPRASPTAHPPRRPLDLRRAGSGSDVQGGREP